MSQIILQGYVGGNYIVTKGLLSGAGTPPPPPESTPNYTLTIAAGSHGTTTPAVGIYTYPEGTEITVTAAPESDYQFRYYYNGASYIESNPYVFTLNADVTLTPIYQAIPSPTPPPDGTWTSPLTFASLFAFSVAKFEAEGTDCTVTLHSLHLEGSYDALSGRFLETFNDSVVKMIIEPQGTELHNFGVGTHAQLKAKAKSKVVVVDGDRITDAFGNVWKVTSSYPYNVGNITAYYEAELSLAEQFGSGIIHPPTVDLLRLRIRVIDGALTDNDTFPYLYPFILG